MTDELWAVSIEPVARAVAASNPRALSVEVATISLAISAKRIADALEAKAMLPDGPIYWSSEEVSRLRMAYQNHVSKPLPEYLRLLADEAAAILRDRGETP